MHALLINSALVGRPFAIDAVSAEDLEAGELKTSWNIETRHHSVSREEAPRMLKTVSIGMLLGGARGAWDVSDEMNRMFPDHEFVRAEDFLRKWFAQESTAE